MMYKTAQESTLDLLDCLNTYTEFLDKLLYALLSVAGVLPVQIEDDSLQLSSSEPAPPIPPRLGDLEDEDDEELPPALPPPLAPEDIPLSPPLSTECVTLQY